MHKERLSKPQADMIRHRLEVPDAIHDALSNYFTRDEVIDTAESLEARVKTGWIWADTHVERMVLADAVEGSVWWAVNQDDGIFSSRSGLALSRLERTVEATTRKVSRVVGEELCPVLW